MSIVNRLALPLCAVLIAFMAYISIGQLTTDASPVEAFCRVAERQGLACQAGATHYGARVVQTDDGVGTQHVLLVVDDGKNVVTVITLQ